MMKVCSSCKGKFEGEEWMSTCKQCYAEAKMNEANGKAEADRKYNIVGIGKAVENKQMQESNAFFGMIFNQTCEFINSQEGCLFDTHFDKVFDKLWDYALKKRKEKMGY